MSTYHLESPNPPDPDFQLALNAPDILQLDTFPPASTCRLPPEQKELLRHPHGIAISKVVSFDVCAKTCESNTADNSLVGLPGAMTPFIVVVEST
jgi:DNA topoisomerase VI subunit B